nr:twin-arginine translocation pathway signal [Caldimonas sp.]
THVYRSPFPRSSRYVSLRPERIAAADREAKAIVTFTRPRGYFGVGRDRMAFDGAGALPGVRSGVPTDATSKLRLADATSRAIVGEFNDERIVGRVWPAADNQVTVLELTY